ncbi:MAG TPA: DOPA 4,5-dioxygenase family protein [Bauldia sp.]|nr:DOPA 4,5-dioxygenase family protein [Bauldia sp.]
MTEQLPNDFHAHIYFDPPELAEAQALAAEVKERFGVAVGHFHQRPVGPHPRGSVQLTVPTDRFGEVASWLAVHRRGLTVFAHASTGDDRRDHRENVVWFGPSEALKLELFD